MGNSNNFANQKMTVEILAEPDCFSRGRDLNTLILRGELYVLNKDIAFPGVKEFLEGALDDIQNIDQ